jgi:hydrogenase nickel incorporation protein HypA/HybF
MIICSSQTGVRLNYFKTHMRELQATQAILAKALTKASEANAQRIKSVHLVIGEIAELDQNSIQQYWEKISKDTLAEQALLHFRLINAKVQCMACFMEYPPIDGQIHCPYCGSYGAKILSGEEFYLESIELDNE